MKVGEFARLAGISVETVRYYHREELLPVPPSTGSYRVYTSIHLDRIGFIQRAKLAGFSLEDIKHLEKLDASNDKDDIRRISEEKMLLLEAKIDELQSAKNFLSELVSACKNSGDEPCPILESLKRV